VRHSEFDNNTKLILFACSIPARQYKNKQLSMQANMDHLILCPSPVKFGSRLPALSSKLGHLGNKE